MGKFYLFLWLKWVIRISLCSVGVALTLTILITSIIYVKQGIPSLNTEIISALFQIALFWFPLIWSLALLLALFRSIKYIFNIKIYGYTLKLSDCKYLEHIEVIGYGDLVKVWRKWFMLLIWLVVVEMILSTVILYISTLNISIFSWFNIYWLFISIIIAGYFSFILLGNRCRRVKIVG